MCLTTKNFEYLGHIITPKELKWIKIKFRQWSHGLVQPVLSNLGISRTHRLLQKICSQLRQRSSAFNQSLKEGTIWMSDEAEQAFIELKQALSSTLTLTLPNLNIPFVI